MEHNNNGFTLLEVLGAMAMSMVAILLISTTLLTSQKSLARSWQRFTFFEEADRIAGEKLGRLSHPAAQGGGCEEHEKSRFKWEINSQDGLINLSMDAQLEPGKLSCRFEILRSAWLQRMETSHE
jgi:type II secretory pathway component PulJ